ncbi:hypothetical protein MTX78_16935 [Hymenobacter tibetensis]|uniref:Uncharacterized protein n=1 Tax=Hymenobacter tibetensis TaxID=497967 RepID=A0ABY4CXS6_9BACT|nr:hypothetical protein [Hymenobacter tibetensis]UOG73799.1 hypothetical protein MTX78_16935 [Hymenobacter tibetensis]
MHPYAVDKHPRQIHQTLNTTVLQQVPDTGRQPVSTLEEKNAVDDAA